MNRYTIILLLFFFSGLQAGAQEILTGLSENPVIKSELQERRNLLYQQAVNDTNPIAIPFYDDFSDGAVFPDSRRWVDRFGFINTDIPVYPINIGVVTLDAINDSGNMYPNAVPGPACFIADHLTSRYIRLDSVFSPAPKALTPSDSVYLSFYYQPQGRARAPQPADSLILQFLEKSGYDSITPDSVIHIPDYWKTVWFDEGMALDTFYLRHNNWFLQVMIPITSQQYFKRKFQFRFLNYASLASSSEPSWQSNCDQWNIDNVYLNINRSQGDTIYPELRFMARPPSLLSQYESMPYPQYCNDPTNNLRDTLNMLITNRDIVPHMSTYGYTVTNPAGSFNKSYNAGNYSIQPYTESPYVTYEKFAHPEFSFLLPISSADSATFQVTHIVKEITPGSKFGDTISAVQRFYNYFAYDDGTPEASYGLTPKGSKLAYRFRLSKSPDTLRAIKWYFNKTLSTNSQQLFYMCIWNDNAGKPGDTIYSDLVIPRYADSLNKFVTYHLSQPLKITGTFYVGWIQTTDDNLSVGFDQYNNSQKEIFYNSTGTWNNSAYAGSLMIRPIFGKPIPLGTDDMISNKLSFQIYPNPCAGGTIHLTLSENSGSANPATSTIQISNLIGHVVYKGRFSEQIDVSQLVNGFYILSLCGSDGKSRAVKKFIISR